jgi:hypothetical protein
MHTAPIRRLPFRQAHPVVPVEDHGYPLIEVRDTFLPRRSEEWLRAARASVANAIMRVFIATGERPSPVHLTYFREAIEEQQAVEAAALERLARLIPANTTPSLTRVASSPNAMPIRSRRMAVEEVATA